MDQIALPFAADPGSSMNLYESRLLTLWSVIMVLRVLLKVAIGGINEGSCLISSNGGGLRRGNGMNQQGELAKEVKTSWYLVD